MLMIALLTNAPTAQHVWMVLANTRAYVKRGIQESFAKVVIFHYMGHGIGSTVVIKCGCSL